MKQARGNARPHPVGIASLDHILNNTFQAGELERNLAFRAFDADRSQDHYELAQEYGVHHEAVRSWRDRGAMPRSIGLVDWATKELLFDTEFYVTGPGSTNLGITTRVRDYDLLETIANLVWTTGSMAADYALSVSGKKKHLDEIANEIDRRWDKPFEVRSAKVGDHRLVLDSKIGRLVWPFLGYTGSKLENLTSIPVSAHLATNSKRRFLNVLNGSRGGITQGSYKITLPSTSTRKKGLGLAKEVQELAFDVTGVNLARNVTKYRTNSYRASLRSSKKQTVEYLESSRAFV